MSCAARTAAFAARPADVSVNGVVIARDAIAREVQQHPAASPVAAWKEAAQALAIRELLLQEARRRGAAPTPLVDASGRRESDEEALIRALIEREVQVPAPNEEECRRYYAQNRRRFRSPDVFEAAHILFAAVAADRGAYARAREAAAVVCAELAVHPDRFAELARRHSDCPSAALGGNLGQITRGQTTPEFERALNALSPGQISESPVATRYGFHVIRLDRRIEGRGLPFEMVASTIAEYLAESVRRRAAAQYIARLAAGATITGIELPSPEAHRVY